MRYRKSLRTAVGASAAPYGYTLATWTTGAVTAHAQGAPSALDALVFMAGAVLGFAFVGALAFGGVSKRFAPEPRESPLWGSFHFLSVGVAIGVAWLVSHVLRGDLAWGVTSFLSTTLYLLILGVQFAVAER